MSASSTGTPCDNHRCSDLPKPFHRCGIILNPSLSTAARHRVTRGDTDGTGDTARPTGTTCGRRDASCTWSHATTWPFGAHAVRDASDQVTVRNASPARAGARAGNGIVTLESGPHAGTFSVPDRVTVPSTINCHVATYGDRSVNHWRLRTTRCRALRVPPRVTHTGRCTHANSRIAGCGAMSACTRPSATKLPSFGVSPNWPP